MTKFFTPLILLFCHDASCFIDAFFKPVEKVADKALILDSLSDLLNELKGNKDLEKELKLLSQDISDFEHEARSYKYLSKDLRNILNPSFNSLQSLHQKIRYSTNYMRRVKNFKKRLLNKFGSSSSAVTASEQMNTNSLLNETLRNQHLSEIRRERKRIAKQRQKLKSLRDEKQFLKKQFHEINRHSKHYGFGAFFPFKNRSEK